MMINKIFNILIIQIFLSSNVFAEELKTSPLSFADCVKETNENNPELLSLYHSKDASAFQQKVAQADYRPSIGAGLSSQRSDSWGGRNNYGNGFSQGGSITNMNSASSDRTTVTGTISVTQNIFSGFANDAALEQATAGYAESKANIALAKARISAELKTSFSTLLYWQRYVKLATKITQRRKENLDVVSLRYKGGNENKGSYLQAKALYEQALYEKEQALREVESSRIALAKVLGRPDASTLQIIDGDMPPLVIAKYDLETEIINHPEVRLSQARKENAEAQLKTARSALYPSINLTAQSGVMDGDSMDSMENYAIGLDASIPIFTFGRNKNKVSKAKSDLAAAKASEVATMQAVRSNIKSAYTAMKSAQDKVQIQTNLREASAVRAEIGRHKYNIGLLNFENWDIIETELINYQKSELLSERERVVAEANWEQSIGEGAL
ncbi:MAG: TolC family protein [Bdellovibrionota bacterium]|jgi:outer membrane protein